MPINFKHFLKFGAVGILVVVVLGYGWFRARDFIAGPVIEIASPQNGATVSEPLVEIQGAAKNISEITLNGRKIFTDKEGDWSEKVLLHPGLNTIILAASDRFDRKTEQKLELVRKERGT